VPVAVRISSERERRKRQRDRRLRALQEAARYVALLTLIALLLDAILIILVAFLPVGILNPLPSQILGAISFLDFRLIASLAVVEVPIGIGIGGFLWWTLGERTQNIILKSEAMMKYYHLRTAERKKKRYIINLNTKQGYLIPFFAQKLASEGIIQRATITEVGSVNNWNDTDPKPNQLGLVSSPALDALQASEATSDRAQSHL
jgi:hypothetical protein